MKHALVVAILALFTAGPSHVSKASDTATESAIVHETVKGHNGAVSRVSLNQGMADATLMDQRLSKLCGPHAVNCGHVQVTQNPRVATRCATRAFKRHKPFYVRYDIQGIDSAVAGGIASNGSGGLYAVTFDGMGMSGDLKQGETMPDGRYILVATCPTPNHIAVNRYGRATCFATSSQPQWIGDE